MVQISQPWGGTLIGDASRAPYSATEWDDMFEGMFDSTVNRGVLFSRGSELVGSPPGGANLFRIEPGEALVKGKWYKSDADEDFNPANSSGGVNVRRDRIVVSSSWNAIVADASREPANQAAQTIRLTRLINPAENVAAPNPTQNDGVLYEIPLYAIEIDAAGTITVVTDDREFLGGGPRLRTFFIPAVAGWNTTLGANLAISSSRGFLLPDNNVAEVWGFGLVPRDFVSDMTITPVVSPNDDGNIYGRTTVRHGRCGEDWQGTTDTSGPTSAVEVTTPDNNCVHQAALTAEAVGTLMRCTYNRDAVNLLDTIDADVYAHGFIAEYLARS